MLVFVFWPMLSWYWAALEQVHDDLYYQKGRIYRYESMFQYDARFMGEAVTESH